MKNRRTILFLCLALAALVAAEVLLDASGRRTRVATRTLLAEDAASSTAISLVRRTAPPTELAKEEGAWRLSRPFDAAAEAPVVLRLLDTLAQAPVEEAISDAELLKLGRARADFALEDPPLRVCLSNATRRLSIAFGLLTPSGEGVYAAPDDSDSVLIVPSSVLSAVDLPVDRFRRRRLFSQDAETLAAFDIRQPAGVVLPFVREGDGWRVGPDKASAPLVAKFLSGLLTAEAQLFVWPTGATNESRTASAALLTGYGLDPETAVTVTLKRAGGQNASVSFGKRADEKTVYAFVHGGGAVVTVDAALKDAASLDAADFSDSRLFPAAAEKAVSLTLADGETVVSLSRAASGAWRLDAPIAAPANAAAVAALLARLPSLTARDVDAAGVSVVLDEGAKPVFVRREVLFPSGVGLAQLRALDVVDFPPDGVRRLVSGSGARGEADVAVVFSRERRSWRVETAARGAVVSTAGVARVLKALSPLKAVRVERLKASAAELASFGLDCPSLRLAVDLDRADAVRRNVLVGARTSDGGSYATVGAADAIFVIPPDAVEALSAPLVERGPSSEGVP